MHAARMRNVTFAEAAQESKELREEVEALNEKLRIGSEALAAHVVTPALRQLHCASRSAVP